MTSGNTPAIIRWDQAYTRNGDGKLPRAVVHAIRTYMDNESLEGWVKRETLMRDTGLSERSVDRQIRANVTAGWLEITSRGHSGGKSNDYRLTYPHERQTDMSSESSQICLPKADAYVSPTSPATSPRTSPKEKFEERTSPTRDTDEYDCLQPDPSESGFGGEAETTGTVDLLHESTSESDPDIYGCLSEGRYDDDPIAAELATFMASQQVPSLAPSRPTMVDPFDLPRSVTTRPEERPPGWDPFA